MVRTRTEEEGGQQVNSSVEKLRELVHMTKSLPPEDVKCLRGSVREAEAVIQREKSRLQLTKLGDLLDEPEEATSWLVEGLLATEGFSIVAAKPKVGKSTLARCLALTVARGEPFLGRATQKGPVVYLALEEKRSEVRRHFKAMGGDDEEVYCHIASSPVDGLQQLEGVIRERKPVLVVIDPLFRFTRVQDGNDYSRMTQALEPLLALARETGAHILVTHHASKGGPKGGDGILGSTAIFGTVDTALFLTRSQEGVRTTSSTQRYGRDLEETLLLLDPETRMVFLGGTREEEEIEKITSAILDFLGTQPEGVAEEEIQCNVDGPKGVKVKALRKLLKKREVNRTGGGKKGDPYLYFPVPQNPPPEDSGILVLHTYEIPEIPEFENAHKQHNNATYSGFRDFTEIPPRSGVPGTSILGNRNKQNVPLEEGVPVDNFSSLREVEI